MITTIVCCGYGGKNSHAGCLWAITLKDGVMANMPWGKCCQNMNQVYYGRNFNTPYEPFSPEIDREPW